MKLKNYIILLLLSISLTSCGFLQKKVTTIEKTIHPNGAITETTTTAPVQEVVQPEPFDVAEMEIAKSFGDE